SLAVDHPALPSFPPRRSSDLEATRFVPARIAAIKHQIIGRFIRQDSCAGKLTLAAFVADGNAVKFRRGVTLTGQADYPGCQCIRSEEHTSELQSRENLVCRLL